MVTHVGSTSAVTGGSSTTISVTAPGGIAVGDCILLGIAMASTRTMTWPGGFTEIEYANISGTTVAAAYKVADGTESSSSLSVTISGAAGPKLTLISSVYTGTDVANPINASDSTTATGSTSYTTPSVSTTADDCVEISFVGKTRGNSTPQITAFTAPSPLTKAAENFTTAAAGSSAMAVGYYLTGVGNGATIGSRIWTVDQSAQGGGITIALKPATVGGGGGGGAEDVTFRASSSVTTTGSSTTATVVGPVEIEDGDLILLAVAVASIRTFTWPSGFTELENPSVVGTAMAVAYKIADGSEAGSNLNIVVSGVAGPKMSVICLAYYGVNASVPIGASESSVSASSVTTYTMPTAVAISPGSVEVSIVAKIRGNAATQITSFTAPSPLTKVVEAFSTASAGSSAIAAGHDLTQVGSGTSVGGHVWTVDGTTQGAGATLVIQPASGEGEGPTMDPGSDQIDIEPGEVVELDATSSSSPNGPVAITWNQTSGSTVSLHDRGDGTAWFTAPYVLEPEQLAFVATGEDGLTTPADSDPVLISVLNHNEWRRLSDGSWGPVRLLRRRTVTTSDPDALIFADYFDRADTTTSLGTSTSGAAWSNTSTNWRILNNAAVETGSGSGRSFAVVDCFNTDVRIEMEFTTSTTANATDIGVTFRSAKTFTGTDKRLYVRVRKISGQNAIAIMNQNAVVAGSDTTLAVNSSVGLADNTTYTLTVEAIGNAITVKLDGVTMTSYTLSGSEDLPGSAIGLTRHLANDTGSKVTSLTAYHPVTKPTIQAAIIAHRASLSRFGDEAEEKIETLPLLREAAPYCTGVEIDARKTSDGGYVLMHDESVDRTTSGSGTVASKTTAQLQALGVPTLADYLDAIAEYQYPLILVQGYAAASDLDDIAAIIAASPVSDRVLFLPAGPNDLDDLRAAWPVPGKVGVYGVNSSTYTTTIPLATAVNASLAFISPGDSVYITNRSYVTNIHAAGLWAGASTVNDSDAVRAAVTDGVEVILTDVADQIEKAWDPYGGVWA